MNTLQIAPRCSGKTTRLVSKFIENLDESIFIVKNSEMKRHIADMLVCDGTDFHTRYIKEVQKRIFSADNCLLSPADVYKIKHVFVDEYLFFTPKQKKFLYDLKQYMNDRKDITWHIETTSDKIYEKKYLELTKAIKTKDFDKYYNLKDFLIPEVLAEVEEVWTNFLTDPSFNVTLFSTAPMYSEVQKKLYILGEFQK
jgi:hypothetical protein